MPPRPVPQIRTGTFHFVRHGEVEAFLRRGWMIAGDLGPTHGVWSVLCWGCGCPVFVALNTGERP